VNQNPVVSVSVVSHRQRRLVESLFVDLAENVKTPIEVILTLNVPESFDADLGTIPFATKVIRNSAPMGFGANHNAAFRESQGQFFCVVNPDIRLTNDPFPQLIECLRDLRVGIAAPLVRSPRGAIEDSARRFPTPGIILSKLLKRSRGADYSTDKPVVYPDWVAGMFMVFRREVFSAAGGFDESFFLYYEDVDLCARLRLTGLEVAQVTGVSVTHAAQRRSHSSLRYARWHLQSMLRFFLKARRMRLHELRRAA
jgi:GT2 family glycosyltransferase